MDGYEIHYGIRFDDIGTLERNGFADLGFDTDYRGDVVICNKDEAVAVAELYDMCADTGRWMFRNVRRLVEFRMEVCEGLFQFMTYPDPFVFYPTVMKIDGKDWKTIKNKINL